MFGMLAVLAEFERGMPLERVAARIARAGKERWVEIENYGSGIQSISGKSGKYCRTKYSLAGGSVGLFDGKRIGFPVHDAERTVVGCHYRLKEDGSWRYHPTGTHTAPFVIGDIATAKTVFAFESQWDALAVLD